MPQVATIYILDGETVELEPRKYELLLLIANTKTEAEIPGIVKSVHDLIVSFKGKITKEVNYGKRRLAYPVQHNQYGYYILYHFDLDADQIKGLDKKLAVHTDLLRHLVTHQIPADAIPEEVDLTYKEEVRPPRREERRPVTKKPSITDVAATEKEKAKISKGSSFDIEKELGVTAEEATAELAKAKEEATDKKDSFDLESLDKKLDEIMGDIDSK